MKPYFNFNLIKGNIILNGKIIEQIKNEMFK